MMVNVGKYTSPMDDMAVTRPSHSFRQQNYLFRPKVRKLGTSSKTVLKGIESTLKATTHVYTQKKTTSHHYFHGTQEHFLGKTTQK